MVVIFIYVLPVSFFLQIPGTHNSILGSGQNNPSSQSPYLLSGSHNRVPLGPEPHSSPSFFKSEYEGKIKRVYKFIC